MGAPSFCSILSYRDKLLALASVLPRMNRLEMLLGSRARGNILEALAFADAPLTAYRIAKYYNMNVAKVYKEMKKLDGLGMVRPRKYGVKKTYELADDDLKNLALKLSSRVQTYASWRSEASRRARFRMGLAAIPPFEVKEAPDEVDPGPRRIPGELENLATLGRKKFDSKYRRESPREYARI
jgi:predicted transcriptional regulator